MTTAEADLLQLQERLHHLELQVGDLWIRLRQQGILTATAPAVEAETDRRERILAILRARGFISDPTPEIMDAAREWRQTPEEEQTRLREKLDSLEMDPPLSQWIHDNRR